ncbi:hypothetical protein CPC08DRAFT_723749 [Agrocybe pediades]|nr:hypothetical protein CPC08DRAFT_723749 [Agrocybe pediades]
MAGRQWWINDARRAWRCGEGGELFVSGCSISDVDTRIKASSGWLIRLKRLETSSTRTLKINGEPQIPDNRLSLCLKLEPLDTWLRRPDVLELLGDQPKNGETAALNLGVLASTILHISIVLDMQIQRGGKVSGSDFPVLPNDLRDCSLGFLTVPLLDPPFRSSLSLQEM